MEHYKVTVSNKIYVDRYYDEYGKIPYGLGKIRGQTYSVDLRKLRQYRRFMSDYKVNLLIPIELSNHNDVTLTRSMVTKIEPVFVDLGGVI